MAENQVGCDHAHNGADVDFLLCPSTEMQKKKKIDIKNCNSHQTELMSKRSSQAMYDLYPTHCEYVLTETGRKSGQASPNPVNIL